MEVKTALHETICMGEIKRMKASIQEKLPFPYFLLTQEIEIKNTSNKVHNHQNFLSLIKMDEHDRFKHFLLEANDQESQIFTLLSTPHRFYKVHEEGDYHLFCYPLEDDSIINSNTTKQMTAEAMHEIRNPLTTVRGFIQLFTPYLTSIQKQHYVQIALEEIDRANELIHQYLHSDYPGQSTQSIQCINTLLEEVCLLFAHEIQTRNIHLIKDFDSNLPQVNMNRNEIKQVMINLIKNAVEALSKSQVSTMSFLSIKSFVRNNQAVILIEDNGCGMSEETLHSLFTPFFTQKVEGTGLGLVICKKIIEKHRGTIKVESEQNKGTIFRMELPCPCHPDFVN